MEVNDSRLRYLYEAERRGTMRAASEHFNVAPSSVSRQIAALERELGVSLVEKGRHTVKLTEAGRLLVDYYRERNGRYESLMAALDDVRGMRTGHVRVAVGQALVNSLLARVIDRYRRDWPGIRIHVMEVATQQVMSLISQDEVHFGLLLNPPPDPQLRDRFHFAQPLRVVMLKTHPLAARTSVTMKDLLSVPLVLPTGNFRSRQLLEEIAVHEGLELDPVMTVSSIHMLVSCIRSGIGVGLLTNIFLSYEPHTEDLIALPIENAVLSSFSVHAMTRIGRTLPKSAQVLLDMVERAIREDTRLGQYEF
ncbi:LysR family transcriptional regulator [Variovorax sp. RB2P76]|uniref:LysR family transcriptional regulator n=1 Tax=Variovorax sp. RB2P76 TaxID=3443736 RepID=UPI003F479AD0